jgi:hypothetical protein
LPVAPVTTMIMVDSLLLRVFFSKDGTRGGKVTRGIRNFSGPRIVDDL